MPLLCDCDRRSPTQLEEEMADEVDSLDCCLSIWLEAPDSILLHIFSFLTVQELGNVCQTCKTWYRIATDESIWRNILQTRLNLDECKLPPGKLSWRQEVKRVYYQTPMVLTETLEEHTDEVLHVSFSHDGSLFSTTSKDASLKVWEVGYPTKLKYSKDFRKLLGWDFTQFSCFNQSDTLVLVSSVKTSAYLDRRGYMAVLSLLHDFEILRVVTMNPSHLFGAWLDDTTFLGGSLQISLDRFTTTVQIEAFDVPEVFSPVPHPALAPFVEETSGRPLFTFSSETASLIKFLTVAAFSRTETDSPPQSQCEPSSQCEEEVCPFTELVPSIHHCRKDSASCIYDGHSAEPGTSKMMSAGALQDRCQESGSGSMSEHCCNISTSASDVLPPYMLDEEKSSLSQVLDNELNESGDSSSCVLDKQHGDSVQNSDPTSSIHKGSNLCSYCLQQSPLNSLSGITEDDDHKLGFHEGRHSGPYEDLMPHCRGSGEVVNRPQSLDVATSRHQNLSDDQLCNSSIHKTTSSHVCKCSRHNSDRSVSSDRSKCSDCMDLKVKNLIFLTGEFAVALHQLGFKNVPTYSSECVLSAGQTPMEDDLQDGYMVVNYSNNDIHIVRRLQEMDRPDNLIDLSGHVTGLCLTPDQRYLFFNCRPWIGEIDRSDPWATPDLSGNIEVRIIDLLTLKDIGVRYTGHKGFSSSNMCCFVFLDVSKDFVASGSEDTQGYLWDRHYKALLANYQHASGVVNAVGFNPKCQEYLVTVSDDGTIKVWRSKQEVKRWNIQPVDDVGKKLEES